jgi:hypothetical protein
MNKEEIKDLKRKKKRNILVKTAIIITALVITFLFDKIEKSKIDEATGQSGTDAIAAMGDLAESAPAVKSETEEVDAAQSEAKEVSDEDAVENNTDEIETDEKMKQASAAIADSYRKHGEGAVLKALDELNEKEMAAGNYPMVEPDFSNLHPINFRGLKKVYTYFRMKETLPEVVVSQLHGAAVVMTGAVMPVAEIPEDGAFQAFWLSNPSIVLAGCVFCSPPTLADIVYVYKDAGEIPFKVDREKLFKQVVLVRVVGRLFFGPEQRGNQTFLFSIQSSDIKILN